MLKFQQKTQKFIISCCQGKEAGSSMIELLLAVFLALFVASTAAQLMNGLHNSGLNRRAAATSAIEVAISNDLAWFRQYAVLWRLQKGPFQDLSSDIKDVTTTSSYSKLSTPDLSNEYDPVGCPPADATVMATKFQNDANKLEGKNFDLIKKPPNPIPNGNSSSEITLSASASGYKLFRTMEPGPILGTLNITYILSRSGDTIFQKSSSIYLPAAGWCLP